MLKVWNQGTKEKYSLRLLEDKDSIDIAVVNEKGERYDRGFIVGFQPEGFIKRYENLNAEIVKSCGFIVSEQTDQILDWDADI